LSDQYTRKNQHSLYSPSIAKVANSSNFFHTSNSGLATYNAIYKLWQLKQVFKRRQWTLLNMIEKVVLSMAAIRILSGTLEITAALFMLHYNTVERALVINSLLSMVGPVIFFSTMTIGIYGLSAKLSFTSLLWIMLGVICIVYGIKR
jgi:Protein of unknown function (DUF2619)